MASLTAIEFGADTCALARTTVRRGEVHVFAAETLDPAAFPGDDSFTVAVRQARKSMKLARRARVVLWGLPEGSNRKDAAVKPLLAPLSNAGFRVERVVTPCNALAALARVRAPRGEGATCWLAINRGGVAIVVVRPGKQMYAHSFVWDSNVGSSGSQARLLQRYSLVSFLSPEIKRAMAEARKLGTPVSAIITCGNLPDLRSLTMPLIEELDVEVETLDSLDGLVVKPPASDKLAESASGIRLACAGAIARGTRPWSESTRRSVHRSAALLRAAAVIAIIAGAGYAWYRFRDVPPVVSGSRPPASSSQLPASGSQPPAPSSQLPASGSQPPASGSRPPAPSSQLPASGSQPPAPSSQLPASGPQRPPTTTANQQTAPKPPVSAPQTRPATPPASATQTPPKPATPPSSATQAPTKPATPPASATQAPTKPATAPASATQAPTKPATPPASATQAPPKPATAPSSAAQTPARPQTPAPVAQTQPKPAVPAPQPAPAAPRQTPVPEKVRPGSDPFRGGAATPSKPAATQPPPAPAPAKAANQAAKPPTPAREALPSGTTTRQTAAGAAAPPVQPAAKPAFQVPAASPVQRETDPRTAVPVSQPPPRIPTAPPPAPAASPAPAAPATSAVNPAPTRADKPGAGTDPPVSAPTGPMPALLKDAIPRVTAILVANDRRFATIDAGQIVGIGDVLGRRIVVGIEEKALVLREPSGVIVRVGLGGRVLGVERGR